MRFKVLLTAALGATLGASIPIWAPAADVPPIGALSVSTVTGAKTVRVSGTVAGEHQLQAVVYATFSPDVPTVFLSRQPLTTDDKGWFSTTLPIAPAYFRGTIITVVVQSPAAVPLAEGSTVIGEPIVPASKQ